MPIKVLVWNIQFFTINKISPSEVNPFGLTPEEGFGPLILRAEKRRYILSNVTETDPDIFVVIEVRSEEDKKGSPITGGGALGCTQLLTYLRAQCDANWCLVPPLKLTDKLQIGEQKESKEGKKNKGLFELLKEGGYTEGIAVFFRKDRLNFLGPYIWPTASPANGPKIAVPADEGTEGPWPASWQAGLPAGNYRAGQYEFKNSLGKEILFPAEDCRRPFLTKFKEVAGKQRTINLVSVHFPPHQPTAKRALGWLIECFGREHPIAKDELVLLAGDFNINVFDETEPYPIGLLEFEKFELLLKNTSGQRSTMYRCVELSAFCEELATPSDYLREGVALDNALVRYGCKDARDGDPKVFVIDRVSLESLLFTPMKTILSQPADKRGELFRLPLNFGKLGPPTGASDHLALLVRV